MLLLAVSVFASCDGSASGSAPVTQPPLLGLGELSVSGRVTNRVSGEAIDGSRVEYRGAGVIAMWQRVHTGSYQIHGMAEGIYEVVVMSNEHLPVSEHVEHRNRRVEVNRDNQEIDFSVLAWGSQRFGAVYDQEFHEFFDDLARVEGERDAVWKWSVPPSRIYVVRDGVSKDAADEFLSILREVNLESVSDAFGDTTGPLVVESGPPIGSAVPGTLLMGFHQGATVAEVSAQGDGFLTTARIRFSAEEFDDAIGPALPRIAKKRVLAHELFHCAGATDVDDPTSLMSRDPAGTAATLSAKDRLAAWLINHPDTHPGNRGPDTNPSY